MKYYLKSHYQCGDTIKLDDEDFHLLSDAEDRAAHLSKGSIAYGNVMVIDSETDAVVAEYSSGKRLEQRKQKETIASDLHRVASLHPRNNMPTINAIIAQCTECAKSGFFRTMASVKLMQINIIRKELEDRGFKVENPYHGLLEINW